MGFVARNGELDPTTVPASPERRHRGLTIGRVPLVRRYPTLPVMAEACSAWPRQNPRDWARSRHAGRVGMLRASVASIAVLIWLLLGSGRSPAQTLSQLPPIVAQTIRGAEESCIDEKPQYRLDEVVYQVSLSGPGTRDYVVDMRNFRCGDNPPGFCGVSGVCGFHVFLNPTPGRWVSALGEGNAVARGWYTVRRKGPALLVVLNSCDAGDRLDLCVALYRASGDELMQIGDQVLSCRRSGAPQRKWPTKQPRHEGHCAATVSSDYRLCQQQCGEPFTSER
jgi:hypothetical protein